jgi:hypothetical protein
MKAKKLFPDVRNGFVLSLFLSFCNAAGGAFAQSGPRSVGAGLSGGGDRESVWVLWTGAVAVAIYARYIIQSSMEIRRNRKSRS